MCIITECKPLFHPPSAHRILYTGHNLSLLKPLRSLLRDCFIVRSPSGGISRLFIRSQIDYTLFLLDQDLPDTTGLALARSAREFAHCEQTPIIILATGRLRDSDKGILFKKPHDVKLLARVITRLLNEHESRATKSYDSSLLCRLSWRAGGC